MISVTRPPNLIHIYERQELSKRFKIRASSGYGFLAYSDIPYSFSFIFGFRIYSDMVAQQDLAFKMTHIKVKSIKI